MQNRYSIVISPPDTIIVLVKLMKEQLAEEIGWFHSKNSLAHITINEFMTTEIEIESIKKQLTAICDTLEPATVHLNSFDTYPNGAFFIAPDENSKNELKKIIKQIHQLLRVKTLFKNNEPHLSIGRQLKPDEISAAYRLFTEVDINFLCNSVSLRCFDPNKKQFKITDTFEFKNNPSPTFVQGTLF
ncbi:2'-5' RNA ligase family protein [Flavobacterium sp. W1B]|uniref:2'-5' RNA ligase family protein n=1 Tax=Flavobacterium sp. W1B TaxID=3394146 RepID=UPI0039BCA566